MRRSYPGVGPGLWQRSVGKQELGRKYLVVIGNRPDYSGDAIVKVLLVLSLNIITSTGASRKEAYYLTLGTTTPPVERVGRRIGRRALLCQDSLGHGRRRTLE